MLAANWPDGRQGNGLVFVDLMNAFLSTGNVYQGTGHSIGRMLHHIRRLADELTWRQRIFVYVDLTRFREKNPLVFPELVVAAADIRAELVDVPPKHGKDDVDAFLMSQMEAANRHEPRTKRFLLVTSDKDFKGTTGRVAAHRPLYLGVSPTRRLTSLAKVATGWKWFDPHTLRHMATYDDLNFDDPGDANYLARMRHEQPDYRFHHRVLQRILSVIEHGPLGFDESSVAQNLYQRLKHERAMRMTPAAWQYYAGALIHYGVIVPGRHGYVQNTGHRVSLAAK